MSTQGPNNDSGSGNGSDRASAVSQQDPQTKATMSPKRVWEAAKRTVRAQSTRVHAGGWSAYRKRMQEERAAAPQGGILVTRTVSATSEPADPEAGTTAAVTATTSVASEGQKKGDGGDDEKKVKTTVSDKTTTSGDDEKGEGKGTAKGLVKSLSANFRRTVNSALPEAWRRQ